MTNIENANSKKTDEAKQPENNQKNYSSDIAALIDRPKKNPEKEEK